jgi:signal peptidase II
VAGVRSRVTDAARRRRWLLFAGIAIGVLVADQLSKLWVDANFELASPYAVPGVGNQPTQIVGDLVRIAKSYNDGGIFGIFGSSAPVLALASLAVMVGIIWYEAREGMRSHWLLTVALGLVLGGALGNFADRARIGHVIDWVDIGIGGVRWYTFNIADAAISISIVLFIGLALFGNRLASPDKDGKGVTTTANAEAPQ